MAQMTVLMGPERRRRWSDDDRFQILAEAFAPGARVADVARRYDVSRGLIYHWRREARRLADPGFVPAVMTDGAISTSAPEADAVIVLDLPDGRRVRISASAPPALVSATLKALR
jgi:transposase